MAAKSDLDMLTDVLNELIERAEVLFKTIRVPASVPVDGDHWLSFGKFSGSWRITWSARGYEPAPLASTARSTRVVGARAIPKLHEALLGERAAKEVEMRKLIDDLEAYLERFETA